MKPRRFYVASSLTNAVAASRFASKLKALGWVHTYDWTATPSAASSGGTEQMRQVAIHEVYGVVTADVVILLLPGGRGTHTELGAALGNAIPVVIVAPDEASLCGTDGYHCTFYHHPRVTIVRSEDEAFGVLESVS